MPCPVDLPPWEAVYAFFERWNGRGLPQALVTRLRELLRQHQGRAAQPTACIIDSQMIKAHDTVSKKTSGYHGGKKITGRGRHLAVDTEGWLLALVVTAASVSDKAGAKILLIRLFDAFSTLKVMWGDSGYDGRPLARYAQAVAALTVEVVARTSPHSFQVLRRRWVVERTFGWLMRYRRLARDYERTTANSEAMIYWATVIIMTRRLARYENGQPPIQRWGGERPRPTEQTALSTGSKVALPTLGAILIFAAVGSLRFAEVATILRTGLTSQIAVVTTFAATLFLPVAAAVGIGVALSLLLQLNSEAMDLKMVELLPREDGRFEERSAPSTLTSDHVTILDVYGSLLYAGTRTLQARLPDPAGAEAPVVILRLRGRTSLGSTFVKLVGDYADRLDDVGGRLYLTGLQPTLTEQLDRTGSIEGPVRAFEATPVVGESTQAAYLDAEAWLVRRHGKEKPAG